MTIGTGIAILGVWLAPVASMLSRYVGGAGVLTALVFAMMATGLILGAS